MDADQSDTLSDVLEAEGGSGPESLHLVCGFLGCDALPFNPVLTALPALLKVRVHGESGIRLNALLDVAVAESNRARPGSRSVLLRLAELVFVEVLRSYLTTASEDGASELRVRGGVLSRVQEGDRCDAGLVAQPATGRRLTVNTQTGVVTKTSEPRAGGQVGAASDDAGALHRVIPIDQLDAEPFGLRVHHQRVADGQPVESVAA